MIYTPDYGFASVRTIDEKVRGKPMTSQHFKGGDDRGRRIVGDTTDSCGVG
jgi:hypothetical protein